MEMELVAVVVGLITVIGGGGVWLGVLHNRVTNNEADIEKLTKLMNGHVKEFNTVVNKVTRIEFICDNIYSKLNGDTPKTKRITMNPKDGPEG